MFPPLDSKSPAKGLVGGGGGNRTRETFPSDAWVWDWVRVLNELRRDCDRHTNVYFIASPDAVKIGIALDVERRLAGLQCGSPLPLELIACFDGSRELEKRLHDYFADERVRGEWFRASPRILEFAAAITYALKLHGEVSA